MFWQNRAFHVEITGAGTGLQSQQNLVSLLPMLNQAGYRDCAAGARQFGSCGLVVKSVVGLQPGGGR